MVKRILDVLVAGALGGLANSIGIWAAGVAGITTALGFQMTPELTPAWLLPRILTSAAWGFLFLLPFWPKRLFLKGTVLSMAPALFMLLVVFPKKMDAGMFGLKLGATAPAFVVVFTLLWGLTAAAWLQMQYARKR